MKITYDREADALYISLSDAAEVETTHWSDTVAADFDSTGKLAGIEILDASLTIGTEALRASEVEDITRSRASRLAG